MSARSVAGIFQADIYAGYNALYVAGRSPGPVTEAACWSHSRRKFFELADIAASARRGKNAPPISPLALEAVKRIDVLFDIERGINGESAEHRLAVRKEFSAPVLADLKDWMQAERRKLSRHSPVAKAMDYMLRRWELFARFLDDGRIRRAVCGYKPAAPPPVFSRADRAIEPDRYVESVRAYLLNLPDGHAFPSDDAFRAELTSRNMYRFRHRDAVLERLENHGRKETVQLAPYTVERTYGANCLT